MALIIPHDQLDQLRRHGEEAYPREGCGVLVGEPGEADQRTVRRVVRCANVYPGPRERRYQISPRELLRVQREAHEAGLAVVGFYHSHPDQPPKCSKADLAEAYWTGCSYVITSVEAGKASETRSYLLRGGEHSPFFEDESIEISDLANQ
jgi:proteasome lid subunit RPN8/RPN11